MDYDETAVNPRARPTRWYHKDAAERIGTLKRKHKHRARNDGRATCFGRSYAFADCTGVCANLFTKFVSNRPARKSASAKIRWCSGIVV